MRQLRAMTLGTFRKGLRSQRKVRGAPALTLLGVLLLRERGHRGLQSVVAVFRGSHLEQGVPPVVD